MHEIRKYGSVGRRKIWMPSASETIKQVSWWYYHVIDIYYKYWMPLAFFTYNKELKQSLNVELWLDMGSSYVLSLIVPFNLVFLPLFICLQTQNQATPVSYAIMTSQWKFSLRISIKCPSLRKNLHFVSFPPTLFLK